MLHRSKGPATGVGGLGSLGGGGWFLRFFRFILLLLARVIPGIVACGPLTNVNYLKSTRLTSSKMSAPVGAAADLANWVQEYWKLRHSGRSLMEETGWPEIEERICYVMVSEGYATVTRPRMHVPTGMLEVDRFCFSKLFTLTTTSPDALLRLWYLCQ